jgi:transmembrane sensor
MDVNNEHIDSLIIRYLSGEASGEDAMFLDDWRYESVDNERYYNQFCFVHQKAFSSSDAPKPDVNRAWGNLYTQIATNNTAPQKTAKTILLYRKRGFQLAASFLLLAGLVFFFLLYKPLNFQTQLVIANTDSIKNISLADHSKVCINKNTTIRYDKDFGKKNRRVNLSGEAFFEVKHAADKPFIVDAGDVFVKDIGTAFSIKAYKESNIVEVYVVSGVVVLYSDNSEGIVLTEGETGLYNRTTGKFEKKQKKETVYVAPFYQQNLKFIFNNTRMSEVARKLSDAYKVNIRIDNQKIEKSRINVSFENEKLESILNIISETLGISCEKTSDGYLLKQSSKSLKAI